MVNLVHFETGSHLKSTSFLKLNNVCIIVGDGVVYAKREFPQSDIFIVVDNSPCERKMEVKLLLLIIFLFIGATSGNYKNKYCQNKEFIPLHNKYPHLHCGRDFLTYSSAHKHDNFVGPHGVECKKVQKVLDYDINDEIRAILSIFYDEECVKEPSRKRTSEESYTSSKKKRDL